MSLISNITATPKSPSPLRTHFNTLPSRSPPSGLQVPQYPTPIHRLGIPRSHSTSSLHDLVTDLRQQQYQQKLDEEEEKKRLEEASKNSISRHTSFVVRYYNKAKSRSPSLSKALSSASPKKNSKCVPQQQPPPKKTKKPEPSPIVPGTAPSSVTEPRIQRADSRVKVELPPTPLVEPSAAVIEEVTIPIPESHQAVIINGIVVEDEKTENQGENDADKINEKHQDVNIDEEHNKSHDLEEENGDDKKIQLEN
ncbi:hypothetical protein BDA99DRAFT_519519, partial [Phascolomyces articulosus]